MKISTARDNTGAKVTHHPTGRTGTLTGFSGLVRVFVRWDDGTRDDLGTLPGELSLIDAVAVNEYERHLQEGFNAAAAGRDCSCDLDANPFCKIHG